jgi:hypothetical protein
VLTSFQILSQAKPMKEIYAKHVEGAIKQLVVED